jgi:hypothetical protein
MPSNDATNSVDIISAGGAEAVSANNVEVECAWGCGRTGVVVLSDWPGEPLLCRECYKRQTTIKVPKQARSWRRKDSAYTNRPLPRE